METGDELTRQVKSKLALTWDDEITDERIADVIASAKVYLTERLALPPDFDFSTPGPENTLFLTYCYYEYNDAADEFETNYQAILNAVRRTWEVKAYVKEEEGST